jgi:site-specific recombinase XerD
MTTLRSNFIKKLELRGLSKKTIDSYVRIISLLTRFHRRSPINLNKDDIEAFIIYETRERRLSSRTINQHTNALKTFFKLMVPDKIVMEDFPRMKIKKTLPVVLDSKEVQQILDVITNLKHKTAVTLLYSSGLRVSECASLKITDIDSKRMLIRVRQGKGKKDRYTILSKRALKLLRIYYQCHRPKEWLFPGQNGHITSRLLEKCVTDASIRAGIKKSVSPHTLRHSFATHLLEAGIELQIIQKFLGHYNINTTTIYTHVTKKMVNNVMSPLDMDINNTVQKEVSHA